MAKMILTKEDTYEGSLILVTPKFSLRRFPAASDIRSAGIGAAEVDAAEIDSELSGIPSAGGQPNISLRKQAAGSLQALLSDIGCENEIAMVSGYRTQEEQEEIWEESMTQNGEEFTRKFVAVPGHSEHQTGYAVDLARNTKEIDFICPEFPRVGIFQRFRDRMASFGFVERYTAGKEEITGIGAEPWHFRYVGYPHSVIMLRQGMVLEEYIEFLSRNTKWEHPYVFQDEGRRIEVSYVSLKGEGTRNIDIPARMAYQCSGTNEGGVVISCRKGAA